MCQGKGRCKSRPVQLKIRQLASNSPAYQAAAVLLLNFAQIGQGVTALAVTAAPTLLQELGAARQRSSGSGDGVVALVVVGEEAVCLAMPNTRRPWPWPWPWPGSSGVATIDTSISGLTATRSSLRDGAEARDAQDHVSAAF